jgi:hypothetical protein
MNNVIDDPAYAEVLRGLHVKLDSLQKLYGDSDSLAYQILKSDLGKTEADKNKKP